MVLWQESEVSKALDIEINFKFKAERVCTDTRKIKKNDLFICLKGENFDGNNFAAEAIKKGAVAVISDEPKNKDVKNIIIIEDSLKALGSLAKYRRKISNVLLAAITGSVGKTTTKEIASKLLATNFKVHATEGNLNNHIGVPLTLVNMPLDAEVAIIEMGMNHENEISHLSQIAKPNITCISWVAENHIENLGSVENIAKAKAEIFDWQKKSGTAILPADNKYFVLLEELAEENGIANISSFGEEVNVYDKESDTAIILNEKVNIPFTLTDNFHFNNILAALTVAKICGLENLQNALEKIADMKAYKGRGDRFIAKQGFEVIDESYNASPTSMKAALDKFSSERVSGKKILVLGDMLELGEFSKEYHEGLAEDIKNIDICLTFGERMKDMNSKIKGNKNFESEHLEKLDDIENYLLKNLKKGDVVLVKGSHGSNLWKLVETLRAK